MPVTKRGGHWYMGRRRYASKAKALRAYRAYLAKTGKKGK